MDVDAPNTPRLDPADEEVAQAMLAATIDERTQAIVIQTVMTRRAVTTLADQVQKVSLISSEALGIARATAERVDRLATSTGELAGQMGQALAAISKTERVDAAQEARISTHETDAEATKRDLAHVKPKVEAHDKLFKPTVLVRNTLLFAGGIVAYLGHLLLKHFDSFAKIQHFFGS